MPKTPLLFLLAGAATLLLRRSTSPGNDLDRHLQRLRTRPRRPRRPPRAPFALDGVPVVPNAPKPLSGGAAAALEFD